MEGGKKSDEDRGKSQESLTWKRERVSCFDSSDTEDLQDHGVRNSTEEMTENGKSGPDFKLHSTTNKEASQPIFRP